MIDRRTCGSVTEPPRRRNGLASPSRATPVHPPVEPPLVPRVLRTGHALVRDDPASQPRAAAPKLAPMPHLPINPRPSHASPPCLRAGVPIREGGVMKRAGDRPLSIQDRASWPQCFFSLVAASPAVRSPGQRHLAHAGGAPSQHRAIHAGSLRRWFPPSSAGPGRARRVRRLRPRLASRNAWYRRRRMSSGCRRTERRGRLAGDVGCGSRRSTSG